MHPLDGSFLKLRRAKDHLKVADDIVKGMEERKPYRIVREVVGKGQTRECLLQFEQSEPLPSDLPLLLGDIFNNLRSALDYLVWQLHLLRDPLFNQNVQFPIWDSPGLFKSKSTKDVGSLSNVQQAAIETLQPYWTKKDALSILRDANDSDKHRLVQIVMLQARYQRIRVAFDQSRSRILVPQRPTIMPIASGTEIEDGTILARIPFNRLSGGTKVHVQSEVILDYAFTAAKLKKAYPIRPTLESMVSEVSHAITFLKPEFAHLGTSTVKV